MGLGPRALGGVTVTVAQQEGFELRPCPPQVLHRVGAGAAEVTHGLVVRVGHMHGGQLRGPMQAGQLERVAPVGLHPVAGAARNQRRGDHGAVDLELREPPRQYEARRTGFVADPQLSPGVGFAQLRQDLLQGVEIIGDGAVETGFAAPAFGQGHGDVFGVDVESDEE